MNSNILWGRLLRQYERELKLLFQHTPMTIEGLHDLANSPWFKEKSWAVARRMVETVHSNNSKAWKVLGQHSKNPLRIYEELKRLAEHTPVNSALNVAIAQNASLIQSLPLDVSQHITEYASQQFLAGKRASVVEKEIRKKAPYLALSRVQLIARTSLSTVETSITKARSESLGIKWYVWLSSFDQRTRKSHRNLHNVLVLWNDPPSPEALVGEKNIGRYHAGCVFNCRCLATPVVSMDEVKFPAKYFKDGVIQNLTQKIFKGMI